MTEIKITKNLPSCSRCSFTGVIELEKNGVTSGFSCLCEKGKSYELKIKNYEWALANGYKLTENSELMFKQYDEVIRTIKINNDEKYIKDYLPYKDN